MFVKYENVMWIKAIKKIYDSFSFSISSIIPGQSTVSKFKKIWNTIIHAGILIFTSFPLYFFYFFVFNITKIFITRTMIFYVPHFVPCLSPFPFIFTSLTMSSFYFPQWIKKVEVRNNEIFNEASCSDSKLAVRFYLAPIKVSPWSFIHINTYRQYDYNKENKLY